MIFIPTGAVARNDSIPSSKLPEDFTRLPNLRNLSQFDRSDPTEFLITDHIGPLKSSDLICTALDTVLDTVLRTVLVHL